VRPYRRAVSKNPSPKLPAPNNLLTNQKRSSHFRVVEKRLHVLVEEAQQNTVSIHVVLLDILVFEVGTVIRVSIFPSRVTKESSPSSHESMDLVVVPLDNVLGLDTLLPLLDSFLVLVVGVNHCGVACSSSLEKCVLLRRQVYNLAAPAETDNAKGCDVLVLALNLFNDLGDTTDSLGWCAGGLEEFTETLALLLLSWLSDFQFSAYIVTSKTYSVRGVVADVNGLALEKVGHEDLVLVLLVAGCEDIGALDGLVLEAKDVVDDQESFLSIARTSDIGLHAINGRVGALGFIAFANDRRNGTASLRLHFAIISDELIRYVV
jgi:hypothetical protein